MQPRHGVAIFCTATFLVGTAAVVVDRGDALAQLTWPVGLVTALLVWLGPRIDLRLVVALLLGVGGPFAVVRWPWDEAIAASLAFTTSAVVGAMVLTRNFTRRPQLLTEREVLRFGIAAVVSGLATCAVMAAFTPVFGFSWEAGPTLGLGTVATILVIVPLFVALPPHRSVAGWVEQAVQWAFTAGITLAVFWGDQPVAMGFLVMLALSWGARRLSARSVMNQVLMVALVATVMTNLERGLFSPSSAYFGALEHPEMVLLHLFIITCAAVTVPLALTVTMQRTSTRQAHAARLRAERIISSADSVAIIEFDLDGSITSFNPGAERLLGYREGDVIGRHARLLVSPIEVTRQAKAFGIAEDFRAFANALAIPGQPALQVVLLRRDGTERVHLLSLSAMRDLEGEITSYVCMSDDITDRVLEELALQEAVARLEAVDAAKDVFVSSVSHELRTPLASIIGYLELLGDEAYGELTEAQLATVGRISHNSQRLMALIDDLLTFARLGESEGWIERSPVDLVDVVIAGCQVVEPVWESREVRTTVVVPDHEVVVGGDAMLLERMIVNLVGNAVKFTPPGNTISVVLRQVGTHAELEISDTGIGIPADEIPRLFGRFYRSRVAIREAVQGSGLGLSIVRSIVDGHNGSIDISSEEGVGTTVLVTLPVTGGNIESSRTVGPTSTQMPEVAADARDHS